MVPLPSASIDCIALGHWVCCSTGASSKVVQRRMGVCMWAFTVQKIYMENEQSVRKCEIAGLQKENNN